jgi:hypothetical protein
MTETKAIALRSDIDKSDLKDTQQTWIIYPELFRKINEKIPSKNSVCRTVLLYLIFQKQNGDFTPAEETIRKYCNISAHSSYVDARKWLHDNGFITYIPYREIIINYQKIME